MQTASAQPPEVPGYRIGALIGRGSSATVWAASPTDRKADLAVKVVPLSRADDGSELALELSALAMARGREDHLIATLDVVPITDPVPAIAIVMERLRQGTLTRLVETRGHLTPGEVVTILSPVALALASLHDAAVVHGDVSPSNIGFDGRGRPVVLDLGVSGIIGTPREEIYGTAGFVAAEVVAGELPSQHSDVYGLGALGWYALTGEPPPIPAERPPLVDLLPDLPAGMVTALERALHPDPECRGDGREMAAAIYASAPARPIQPGEGEDPATMLTHRVRRLAGVDAADSTPDGVGRRARHASLRSRSRTAHLRVLTLFVAALILGSVGVAAAAGGRDDSAKPAATPVEAPSTDHVATVASLVEARAAAWREGDVDSLLAVFGPDSDALGRDVTLLAQAVEDGHRYEGLDFAVTDVRTLFETQDRVGVEATIATSPYAVVTGSGETASVATREGSSARIVLTIAVSGARWRIVEVEPADP